jgi:hydrogenase maturation protease
MHKLRDTPCETEEDLKAQLEEIAGKGKVYVLGLGNTDRADDGAGILVAEALKKPFPLNSFSEHDGIEGTVLDISEKDEDATVIVVDAADMKKAPGSIALVRREDIRETEITTHRVAVALMASVLDKAGKATTVLCIQPAKIEFRGEVTPAVRRSIDNVVRVLAEMIRFRS